MVLDFRVLNVGKTRLSRNLPVEMSSKVAYRRQSFVVDVPVRSENSLKQGCLARGREHGNFEKHTGSSR